jgi:TolB protein
LAWAPDGQSLAFIRDDRLWLIDASGNERLVNESVSAGYPSWSPDGSRVVAESLEGMVIIGIADGAATSLAASPECYGSPDWAPAADLIVFTGSDQCEGGEPNALYLIRPDGTHEELLRAFDEESGSGSWSPDGTLIALQSDVDGGCLYVMNADGSDLRRLTRACIDGFSINWAPDGSQLVGSGSAHGPERGFVVNLEGTEKAYLSALGSISYLDWRPLP